MEGRASSAASELPRLSTELRERGEREYLLDRLHNLRRIVPVFAEELASARRQSAALRVENRRLLERIRQLQEGRTQGAGAAGSHAGIDSARTTAPSAA